MNAVRREALKLLRSAFFFARFLRDIRRAGVVGEERNALVVFIVATSRLLPDPLHLLVKGPSGIGKNWLTDKTLEFIPPSEVHSLSASSKRAWNYQGKNLAHKVVYVNERNDDSGPVLPLRVLLSARHLAYDVTAREGNRSVVKKVITRGPIAAISTTTKDRVEVDDETRHLSIWLDESAEQTSRIVSAAVEHELDGNATLGKKDQTVWHDVQRLLKGRSTFPIKFPPWLRQVGEAVQTDSIWARRYFSAFLRAVKTIALMRSFYLKREELERRGNILVRFCDVAIATVIFGPVFAQSLRKAEEADVEIRHRIAGLSTARDGRPVSASDLSLTMGLSMDKTYALIRKAESAGTIRRANSTARSNRKLYLPSPLRGFLPDPEEIFRRLIGGPRRVQVVDPLSGEWMIYERNANCVDSEE